MELIILNMHRYFLGGASPNGFVTKFGDQIDDTEYCTYIIKGGPGTGKSTLMKKIAETFPDEDKDIYYCSADPGSLDAVVLKNYKVTFVDGTAPHVFDPEYPGAVQKILNLGEYWDLSRLINNKDSIIEIQNEYAQYHLRCRRFIAALASVTSDTIHITSSLLNKEKLNNFIERLSKKIIPKNEKKDEGKIIFKQLSALTPKGYMTFVPKDCDVFLINDPYFSGTDLFLREFTDILNESGYDVIVSKCTVQNGNMFEHIYIPELNTAFISSNTINEVTVQSEKVINFMRFYNKEALKEKKARIKFNKKAVSDLLAGAVECLVNAKATHDLLEEYYIGATDFDGINRLVYKLISEIKSKA